MVKIYAKIKDSKVIETCRKQKEGFVEIDEQSAEVQSFYKPPKTYKELRVYPTLEEQLDMQYWDRINGTNRWQDTITEVKLKTPKEI